MKPIQNKNTIQNPRVEQTRRCYTAYVVLILQIPETSAGILADRMFIEEYNVLHFIGVLLLYFIFKCTTSPWKWLLFEFKKEKERKKYKDLTNNKM